MGDLTDAASLERALTGCEAAFHVAADYRLWAPRPQELYRTNVDGTGYLLEAAQRVGVRRIVYTSSVATVGLPALGGPGSEDAPVGLADMIGHYEQAVQVPRRGKGTGGRGARRAGRDRQPLDADRAG